MSRNHARVALPPPKSSGCRWSSLFWVLAGLLFLLGVWRVGVWVTAGKGAGPARSPAVLGGIAPDFVLKTPEGEAVHLSDKVGRRPLVLLFGSNTCPYCVGQIDLMVALERKYRSKVDFMFIYCKEAHPDERMASLRGKPLPVLGQTVTWKERAERARRFAQQQGVTWPILVDKDGEESVQSLYGGNPSQLIVIGVDKKVLLRGGVEAPFGLDAFLRRLLSQAPRSS